MAIGRSDVRHTQRDHTASLGRHGVWAPDAKPIWASGDVPRQQAGNTTAVAPVAKFLQKPLASRGPFSNRASLVNTLLLAAAVAVPGSRFSPRSAYAAASSGPKHRRCNVHNGLTCNARGPTASLAASLHLRPGGQPSHPRCCRMYLDDPATRPEPALAPTSGTARPSARCCVGSRTACVPAPRAPCRCRTASRSPVPSLSGAKPT